MPAYTRSPACFAQCVASLADAAPGRFAIGIGSSSNVIVERWNGVPFVEPYKKVRDVVRFLRDALGGEKVSKQYDTFEVQRLPARHPPRAAAADPRRRAARGHAEAGRPGGATGRSSTGSRRRREPGGRASCSDAAGGEEKEIVARIFVCPSENAEVVRAAGKFAIAAYLNVPVYAAFHDWLGRGDGAAADVGRLEGRRPQGRAGGDPRLAGGRADRPRLAGRVPGEDPALLRQRRHHDVAGDHAAGPRSEALGRRALAGAQPPECPIRPPGGDVR